MISLDTNVVVRIVTRDDPEQSEAAWKLVQQAERVWLAKTVVLETEWVLRYCYDLRREAILRTLRKLLAYPPVRVEDRGAIQQALEWYATGLDFADALHLASGSATDRFATFDRKLAKIARRVEKPPQIELL